MLANKKTLHINKSFGFSLGRGLQATPFKKSLVLDYADGFSAPNDILAL